MAARIATVGVAGLDKPSLLFDLEHAASNVMEFQRFASYDAYNMAVMENDKIVANWPFVIEEVADVETIYADKDVKSNCAIFFVQIGNSTQAKTQRMGQQPMITPRNEKLREKILKRGPPILSLAPSGGASKPLIALRSFVTGISHYGYLPTCIINGKVERYGLPSWNYQQKGSRECIFVNYGDIAKYFPLKKWLKACTRTYWKLCATLSQT